MNIIYARQPLPSVADNSIFLAGPTPRDAETPSWRPEAIEILKSQGFTGDVFIPEDDADGFSESYTAKGQITWEWNALDLAKVILFWVPRELKKMPALTTNVEFGLHCTGGKVVLGYPEGAPKMNYLHTLADREHIPGFHTLEETIAGCLQK